MVPVIPQLPIPKDWQAVSAAPYVHALLTSGIIDPGLEDRSLKIKACTKARLVKCRRNSVE